MPRRSAPSHTSYWVSTPYWTCLVDVRVSDQSIQRSTAPYLRRGYGERWATWLGRVRRQYGDALRYVRLPARNKDVP